MTEKKPNNDLRNFLILVLVTIALGLSLIIWTTEAIRIICLTAGILMIGYGVYEIVRYFTGNNEDVFRRGIVSGVLTAGFGLICLLDPVRVGDLIGVLIGVGLLVDALFKLQCGLNMIRRKYRFGWLITLLGGIALVLAVLNICLPGMALIWPGIMLLIDGAADIVTLIMLRRFQKGKDILAAPAPAGPEEPEATEKTEG
ncbi:MAG: DUF308 domain-containing protein [Clostridia bacterium]|nr:DUF308 domain-containing protein [Clostridia bacterium]